MRTHNKHIVSVLLLSLFLQLGCQRVYENNRLAVESASHSDHLEDDLESESDVVFQESHGCKHATEEQKTYVNLGFSKLEVFLNRCYLETGSKKWCDQVARPNPSSRNMFICTYSPAQPAIFVHPSESTWSHAIDAVKLVLALEQKKIKVDIIYNWWRPEPYNVNVKGASGRHPLGTSIDVRFLSKADQNKAHAELCKFRKQGKLRALGYYSGTGLHLGIGDKSANTWGKSCSR